MAFLGGVYYSSVTSVTPLQVGFHLHPGDTLIVGPQRHPSLPLMVKGRMGRTGEWNLWKGDQHAAELQKKINDWLTNDNAGGGGLTFSIPDWLWGLA